MFVSEINADKNLPTDISEGAKARPVRRPRNIRLLAWRTGAGGGNGKAAASSRQAPPEKIDDLPF